MRDRSKNGRPSAHTTRRSPAPAGPTAKRQRPPGLSGYQALERKQFQALIAPDEVAPDPKEGQPHVE
jgi:hypothetical protein